MSEIQLTQELNKNSIEWTKNAKGEYQYKLKVYFDDDEQGLVRLNALNEKINALIEEKKKEAEE